MNKYLTRLSIAFAIFALAGICKVQAQASGSTVTYGSAVGSSAIDVASGDTTADVAETMYIGPGNYTIDGTWQIYSKNVWISPDATISGAGTIVFYNPSAAGGAASPTLIDGNNSQNPINVNMQLQNASGMQLTQIAADPALTGAGWTDSTATSSLYIGADLDLAVDGANVTLGTGVTGDLIFDNVATISDYSPARMVITNDDILSHMVKQNYTGSFTFPVGIAQGDYTPAQITNTTANTMHVSVQDYSASASNEGLMPTSNGIMRTWNIYADNASGNSDINLEHNTSTDQSGFNESSHFVTRWSNTVPNTTGDNTLSTSAWQSNTQGAGTLPGTLSTIGSVSGSSMRDRAYSDFATSATDAIAYYSKSSSLILPLPVVITNFTAMPQGSSALVQWTTTNETAIKSFVIERSTDGNNWQPIATITAKGNNSHVSDYSSIDNNASIGLNYYRLKLINTDGSYSYSVVRVVNFSTNKTGITVMPNPATDYVTISLSSASDKKINVIVINAEGQTMLKDVINSNEQRHVLNVANLSSGVYTIMTVDSDGKVLTKQLVIQK